MPLGVTLGYRASPIRLTNAKPVARRLHRSLIAETMFAGGVSHSGGARNDAFER